MRPNNGPYPAAISHIVAFHSYFLSLTGQCGFLAFTDYVRLDTDILITF